MKYQRILRAFNESPWAILPSKLEEMRAFLELKAAGGEVDPADIQALVSQRRPMDVAIHGRVAVVPVFGVISQRASMAEQSSGGVGAEQLGATLEGLVNDKQVRAIVMCIDSPGGSVFGVGEIGRAHV